MTQSEIETYVNYNASSAAVAANPVWAVYQPDTEHYGWMSRAFDSRAEANALLPSYGRAVACVVCLDADDYTAERVCIAPLVRRAGRRYVPTSAPLCADDMRWDVPDQNAGQIVIVAYSDNVFAKYARKSAYCEGAFFKKVTDQSIATGRPGRVTYYAIQSIESNK